MKNIMIVSLICLFLLLFKHVCHAHGLIGKAKFCLICRYLWNVPLVHVYDDAFLGAVSLRTLSVSFQIQELPYLKGDKYTTLMILTTLP